METVHPSRLLIGDRYVIEVSLAIAAVGVSILIGSSPEALAVVLLVLVLATALSRIDVFVYTVVFLIPVNPFLPTELPVRDVSTVLHLFLFVLVIGIKLRRRESLRNWLMSGALNKAVIVFIVVATASQVVINGGDLAAHRAIFRLFSYVALYFGVTGWATRSELLFRLLKIILISTACVAAFGIYQAFIGGYGDLYFRLYPSQEEGLEPWVGRVTSFLFHFNSLAGYLNLLIPLAVASDVYAEGILSNLGRICWISGSLTLLLTQSRGGIIAWIAVIALAAIYLPQGARARTKAVMAIGCCFICLFPLVTSHLQRIDEVDEITKLSRLALWGAAGSMFLSKPVFGVGYGNFRSLYADYIPGLEGGRMDAHNMYLQFLAETGIVGFFLFMAIIYLSLRRSLSVLKHDSRSARIIGFWCCGAVVATLVHGCVDYLFVVSPQFGAMFWLVLAMSMTALRSDVLLHSLDRLIVHPKIATAT